MSRLQQLKTYLDESPDDAFLLFALAKEYESVPDTPEALNYYIRLETVHPNYVGMYYHLGKLYEKIHESEKAVAAYEKGMSVAKRENDRHAFSELQTALEDLI